MIVFAGEGARADAAAGAARVNPGGQHCACADTTEWRCGGVLLCCGARRRGANPRVEVCAWRARASPDTVSRDAARPARAAHTRPTHTVMLEAWCCLSLPFSISLAVRGSRRGVLRRADGKMCVRVARVCSGRRGCDRGSSVGELGRVGLCECE